MKEQDRRANSIDVEASTWARLRLLADEYGVTDQLGFGDVE
jgi:hypothetical protein